MNIKPAVLSLCVILAACNSGGGGHSGAVGAPGKSAYEIWLEQGNVGTEQDFLDSLVSGESGNKQDIENGSSAGKDGTGSSGDFFTNTRLENIKLAIANGAPYYDFVTTQVKRPNQQEYTQFSYSLDGIDSNGENFTYHTTVAEKVNKLGNYYVGLSNQELSDGTIYHYVHPNFDTLENVNYVPFPEIGKEGIAFKGETLAYVWPNNRFIEPRFLVGDMTFVYDYLHPEFLLNFDNYYTLDFKNKGSGWYSVRISGENATGESLLDLPNGEFTFYPCQNHGADCTLQKKVVTKDDVVQAFGKYDVLFPAYKFDTPDSIFLEGVFGGEKQ